MSEAKFTKGPWKVHSNCEVSYDECGLVTIYNTYLVESIANAHLIAAAPEMYDILSAIDFDDGMIAESLGCEFKELVIRVLSKARGEA